MDEEQKAIFQAYKNTFTRKEGQLVFDDLVAAYHERVNPDLEDELEDIPHPFRAYVVMGQRSVVLAIKDAIKQADQPVTVSDDDNSQT